jgi:hypothetical protein
MIERLQADANVLTVHILVQFILRLRREKAEPGFMPLLETKITQ